MIAERKRGENLFDKMKSLAFKFISSQKNIPDDELYRYVLMLAVGAVACSVHIFFTVYFIAVGCTPLGLGHLFGVAVFLVACLLLTRRHYDVAGLMISMMIMLSSVETIYFIGGNNYSILYQFLVLIIALLVPFSNRWIPIAIYSVVPVIMVASWIYGANIAPIYNIGVYDEILGIINILVNSIGIIILFSLDRIVRAFVDTYKVEKYKELEAQAYRDPLTNLYNRRYADQYFEKIGDREKDRKVCLAIADLDDFKKVNDTYGHDTGDEVLKKVSEIMEYSTRKSDIVVRWGGEEFMLILNDINIDAAEIILNRIRVEIENTAMSHESGIFNITITMGLNELDPNDIPASIDKCDRKLYQGKACGKNVVVR